MKKRILGCILLLMLILITLTACGDENTESNTENNVSKESEISLSEVIKKDIDEGKINLIDDYIVESYCNEIDAKNISDYVLEGTYEFNGNRVIATYTKEVDPEGNETEYNYPTREYYRIIGDELIRQVFVYELDNSN